MSRGRLSKRLTSEEGLDIRRIYKIISIRMDLDVWKAASKRA